MANQTVKYTWEKEVTGYYASAIVNGQIVTRAYNKINAWKAVTKVREQYKNMHK